MDNVNQPMHKAFRWIGPVVVSLTMIVMYLWTWRTWPDVLIDFGRELYVPWRITEGDVLYRDVAAFYGPLSQYVNALWFKLLGVSLKTLVLCNFAIVALLAYWFYQILFQISGRLGAFAASMLFITLFAFGHLQVIGNYNFICPYAHEITHGVALAVAAMFCFMRFQQRRSLGFVAAAGLALGMAFLTKLEPFIAVAPAIVSGLCAWGWLERATRNQVMKVFAVFGVFTVIPPLAAFLLFRTAMPADQALRSTLGSWSFLSNSELRSLPFFTRGMGIDNAWHSFTRIGASLAWYALMLGPVLVLSLMVRTTKRPAVTLAVALFAGVGMLLGLLSFRSIHADVARILPIVVIVIFVAIARRVAARRVEGQSSVRYVTQLMFVVFSLLLLLKIMLFTRIYHYGFALALPATLLCMPALLDWIPSWIASRGGSSIIFRAASFIVVTVVAGATLQISGHAIYSKTIPVGEGVDMFMAASPRAEVFTTAMKRIAELAEPGDTLTPIPEGIMLNYLSRMPSPTPYLTFLPPDLLMFGEAKMLDALRRNPPTFIALVHRNTAEYGARFFGQNYGHSIDRWMSENYIVVDLIGDKPFRQDSAFGILLLQRADSARIQPTLNRQNN